MTQTMDTPIDNPTIATKAVAKSPAPKAPTSFAQDLQIMQSLAAQPVSGAPELLKKLTTLYNIFYDVEFEKYDSAVIKANADQSINDLFTLRLSLRNSIKSWTQRGLMSDEIVIALRNLFRILRYASDFVGELAIDHDILEDDEALLAAFSGNNHNTLINPAFGGQLEFQSGDVVLLRGTYANSAAIARIGDVDSQFSHLAIIHREGDQQYLVESLIEEGAIITPLEQAFAKGNSRAILFRHPNTQLAREAAQFIFDHVKAATPPKGKLIRYDFSMKLDNYDTLFCSKLVRMAYDNASDGNVRLPRFLTQFNMKNKDLIKRIGIETDATFAPGDIEVEADFDLVAEWRDYRITPKLRFQDMTMTKIFEWMELYNYRFKSDGMIRMISMFGMFASKLSNTTKDAIKDVIPKVPSHMQRKTIATVIMLHKTAGIIIPQLEAKQAERLALGQRPLHPREVFELLEDIRKQSGGRIGYLKGKP